MDKMTIEAWMAKEEVPDFKKWLLKDDSYILLETFTNVLNKAAGMEREDPEVAANTIVELVQKKLPKYYRMRPSDIQVLTPMQRGVIGAGNLNLVLQEAVNPGGEVLRRAGVQYKRFDKVMQIRNNYDKEVFKGDIGVIESVDMEERKLAVNFDGHPVVYD